jgi:hypothetical protein
MALPDMAEVKQNNSFSKERSDRSFIMPPQKGLGSSFVEANADQHSHIRSNIAIKDDHEDGY